MKPKPTRLFKKSRIQRKYKIQLKTHELGLIYKNISNVKNRAESGYLEKPIYLTSLEKDFSTKQKFFDALRGLKHIPNLKNILGQVKKIQIWKNT